uniref:NADH-ubiquinone oxidoreductase chain 5 n=1 Tax=Laomedia healyi TaxID=576627 RepID=A0A4Y5QJL4_9EUCA|nr:NADH dehydrogenase subunit 5 [Laomedia healyi]QCX31759.1 NADH dehydrogenase subunit 5 [Laomedia healyi]
MSWKCSMHLTSMVMLLLGCLVSGTLSLKFLMSESVWLIEWDIISISSSCLVMTLIFDWMSLMFLSFVLFISSMVLYYSGDYMHGDSNFDRFMYLVIAFVMSMGVMIVSPNLVSILLGWDGLGLVSFALVMYYQNEKSANAAMMTVLSNRVGDVAILLSISLMFAMGGWNFVYYVEYMDDSVHMLSLKFLVILAGMTKSAQIPFSAWLPAAMAAPTPVSSLVHSSTLVTAGVYLVIRFSPALEGSSSQSFLLIISCLTMFMAGLGANFEYDLKKIIALSTLSQLGVMISILSLGFQELAFFHLLTHALFKALLFMCAGVVIHSVKEYQDIRNMGGLVGSMPLTSVCMTLANFALCGMPFLAGFYSKDLILEIAFMSSVNFISFVLYVLATGLTVCYTFRLIFYSLSTTFNMSGCSGVVDNSSLMLNPMIGLSMGAVLMGCSLSWLIFPEPYMICLSLGLKTLPLVVSVLGALIGYMMNMCLVSEALKSLMFYGSSVVAGSMWFLPFLSTFKFSEMSLKLGEKVRIGGDFGWSEFYGGQGVYLGALKSGSVIQMSQETSVKIFMKSFVLWGVVVVFMYM